MTNAVGRMTSRERFLRTLVGEPVDRPPLWEEGIREDVRREWAKQGVPIERDLDREFSVDRRELVQPDIQSARFFAVKNENDDHDEAEAGDPTRYPAEWAEQVREYRERDFPVGLRVSRGLFLSMGVENWRTLAPLLYLVADEPDRVAGLMEDAARFAMRVLERAYEEVAFDFVLFSEPIASNYASVIGPWTYRAVCSRAYRLLVNQAHRHGVRAAVFQSYGNVTALLPEALAVGCTMFWAGDTALSRTSYPNLRLRFPKLGLIGGIDVGLLRKNVPAIEREIRRIVPPLVRSGRYLPLLDGRVRAHVPFSRYAAYRRALVETVEAACRVRD